MEKQPPFYVVVHQELVNEAVSKNPDSLKHIKDELARIIEKEDHIALSNYDDPRKVYDGVPKGREILVCGALREWCVDMQTEALLEAGYDAQIYDRATIASL